MARRKKNYGLSIAYDRVENRLTATWNYPVSPERVTDEYNNRWVILSPTTAVLTKPTPGIYKQLKFVKDGNTIIANASSSVLVETASPFKEVTVKVGDDLTLTAEWQLQEGADQVTRVVDNFGHEWVLQTNKAVYTNPPSGQYTSLFFEPSKYVLSTSLEVPERITDLVRLGKYTPTPTYIEIEYFNNLNYKIEKVVDNTGSVWDFKEREAGNLVTKFHLQSESKVYSFLTFFGKNMLTQQLVTQTVPLPYQWGIEKRSPILKNVQFKYDGENDVLYLVWDRMISDEPINVSDDQKNNWTVGDFQASLSNPASGVYDQVRINDKIFVLPPITVEKGELSGWTIAGIILLFVVLITILLLILL